jgi:hypothetical protein
MDNREVIAIVKSFMEKNTLKVIPIESTKEGGVLF